MYAILVVMCIVLGMCYARARSRNAELQRTLRAIARRQKTALHDIE